LTLRTPASEHLVVDHFSHPRQADASQPQMTLGAGDDAMFHRVTQLFQSLTEGFCNA
jgi:hypothetical protein